MLESNNCEILSPVGSREMLYAAVKSGADAVYLGARDFSARRNAENFGIDELEEVCQYCHIRGVKVYLTLNILIKDNEFCDAVNLATCAYNAGIDGIIIQDLGLAKVLHQLLPELSLHASTQMSIHSPAALPILAEMGFKQVVVAREMSLEDLTAFCKEAQKYDMTVEVFVHGALCMSVSGQCLLSAFLGSRSGNRGLCAGPCRLPFSAKGGTGYDLSLKDLSLTNYIKKLYEIGVGSFKIEGRMKRPEYVAAATKACADALKYGMVDRNLQETLKNVFSRSGFTAGYLENKLGKDMFGIRTKDDVVSAEKSFPVLHELYRNEYKRVRLTVNAKITQNEPICLTLSDGKNIVFATGEVPQKAKNKALTYEDVQKNLTKFGGTPYISFIYSAELDQDLFVPASALNMLRRDAISMLDERRATVYRKKSDVTYSKPVYSKPENIIPDLIIRVENTAQIPNDLSGINGVIFPLENDFNPIENILNIVDIPRGIISETALKKRLLHYKEKGVNTCLCGNLSAVTIAQKCGFKIIADTGLNIYNSESLEMAKMLGANSAVLSTELEVQNIQKISPIIPKGIITYGHIPLMLFKNCPLKNGISCSECDKKGILTDRLGIEFPVRCRMGYSELLNSVPLWLGDKSKDLMGLDFQILYFTNETPERVAEVINSFKNQKSADCKYTRGLFYKGTI